MRSERGFSLLEALLVVVIVGIAAAAVLSLYGEGLQVLTVVARQAQLQDAARRVLDGMVEGVRSGTVRPPGLRAASAVAVSDQGLAYRVGSEVITYYLDVTTLRRTVRQFSGALQVVAEGGEEVLQYVVSFTVSGERLISIAIELAAHMVRDPSWVRQETKVLPRNWSP